jgi:subtilisin-like proprotein convertase family protein
MLRHRYAVLSICLFLGSIALLNTVYLGKSLPVYAEEGGRTPTTLSTNPNRGIFTPELGHRRRMPADMAQGNPLPPNCQYPYAEFGYVPMSVPIPDGGILTSTLTVTGARPYMWDVYMDVFISHTYSGDLDMTLTSPEGTVVTLSTDNGGEYDDIFAFTTFWDFLSFQGLIPYEINVIIASEYQYLKDGVVDALVPEESLQAMSGENPNGTWTLTVVDDTLNGETGTLNNWGFSSFLFPTALVTTPYSFTYDGPSVDIPDTNEIILHTVLLTDVKPNQAIVDIEMTLDITHPNSEDLDLQLRSAYARYNTLGTDNGGSFDNIYSGVRFDDDGDPLGTLPYTNSVGVLSDRIYDQNGAASPMVVEESMGSFMGEDPYGYWELRMIDDTPNGLSGSLNSFTLDMVLGDCPDVTPTPSPTTTPTASPTGLPATVTPTDVPPTFTSTPTSTATATGVPPTATPTGTPVAGKTRLYLPLIQRAAD